MKLELGQGSAGQIEAGAAEPAHVAEQQGAGDAQ